TPPALPTTSAPCAPGRKSTSSPAPRRKWCIFPAARPWLVIALSRCTCPSTAPADAGRWIFEVNRCPFELPAEVRAGRDGNDVQAEGKGRARGGTRDADWWRLRKCFNPYRAPDPLLGACYKPGRMIIPSKHQFTALVITWDYTLAFDEAFLGTTTFPLFMRIAEHRSRAPSVPVPCSVANPSPTQTPNSSANSSAIRADMHEDGDGDADGMATAFLPSNVRFVPDHRGRGVCVHVAGDAGKGEYKYTTTRMVLEGRRRNEPVHGVRDGAAALRTERAVAVL
ncbi:hypothetical protein DFH06DRAFT_53233, partial [Mycena polygramma]